jgi:multicomponent Na+:H+ antiporter subunit D
LRAILVGAGVLTALVGGTMAFFQRDLKRLLAFVTIGHVGIFLAGVGLLTAQALAGTTLYVIADGFLKGGLFLAVGILLRRTRDGDELRLRGKGGAAPMAGVAFLLGGLGLAGLPPFGIFPGSALIIHSARDVGYGWLPPLLTVASILTAGTVLRATARIFLGLGDADDPSLSHEPPAAEEEPERVPGRVSPPLLFGPPLALIGVGLGLAFTPGLAGRATQWAQRLEDRPAHAAEVLRGVPPRPASPPAFHPGAAPYAYGAISTVGAFGFAAFGLYRGRLPRALRRFAGRLTAGPAARLKALHSGVVGDYVAWLTFGAAALGGLLALTVR